MSKNIVHIALDEKFINNAYRLFEKVKPNQNLFIINAPENEPLSLVDEKEGIFKIFFKQENYQRILNFITDRTIVFIHGLDPSFHELILKIPRRNKIIWLLFGYEIYNDKFFVPTKSLLLKKTFQIYPKSKRSFTKEIKEKLRPFYRRWIKKKLPLSNYEIKKKVIVRSDYLGVWLQEEFDKISSLIKQQKTRFYFLYYPLENIVDMNSQAYKNEKDNSILVGNSGSYTNNHLDLFHKIKEILPATEIIVPLSYGDSRYIDHILVEGKKMFQNNFKPLTEFLPITEYNAMIQGVRVAIFGSLRQQAFGNICALLWHGAKIFLSKKNTIFHFLKNQGFIVFSIEEDLNKNSICQPLEIMDRERNRERLQLHLAEEQILLQLASQLEQIQSSVE